MKVALWSSALSYDQVSITHRRVPPEEFRYVKPGDPTADVLMATHENDHWPNRFLAETKGDGRPKVLWRQEARWIMPAQAPDGFDFYLSSDQMDGSKCRYLPFLGSWLSGDEPQEKDYLVSMISSDKWQPRVEGYQMRHKIRKIYGQWEHGYGTLFNRKIETKDDALWPYRFSIAIESQKYPWYHTEKLFDCFAARTVPLYWGCDDFTKLTEWGYDAAGILPWTTPEDLAHLVGSLSVERYESMQAAIHANHERTKELYCTEVALMKVLKEVLCLV